MRCAQVHIVTGGYSGVGLELVKILYAANATVYVAGRSADKANKAIEAVKHAHPEGSTGGRVEFLQLDLAHLASIKKSADEFAAREQRLDVLTNNAGVMFPPKGSKSEEVCVLLAFIPLLHDGEMGTDELTPQTGPRTPNGHQLPRPLPLHPAAPPPPPQYGRLVTARLRTRHVGRVRGHRPAVARPRRRPGRGQWRCPQGAGHAPAELRSEQVRERVAGNGVCEEVSG